MDPSLAPVNQQSLRLVGKVCPNTHAAHTLFCIFQQNTLTHTPLCPLLLKMIHCLHLVLMVKLLYIILLQPLTDRLKIHTDDLFPFLIWSFPIATPLFNPFLLSSSLFPSRWLFLMWFNTGAALGTTFYVRTSGCHWPQYSEIKVQHHYVSNNPFSFYLVHYITHHPLSNKCVPTGFTTRK